MWRWVTRGLVLSFVALLAPMLFAQPTFQFVGDVDAPDPARIHSGVVLVKGWALDPAQISRIELWVDDQFLHKTVMFLPRIDVEQAYPDWPGIHTARPGFTTGFLASRFPDGPHTVEMRAYASNGDVHTFGRRTITINNSINQSPFGALDIPGGVGITNLSGAFPVVGWAADTDGLERIEVMIDGTIMQDAIHGDPRPDVGATFADFTAAAFSGFIANIDSTRLQNGVHLLEVRAIDNDGVIALIGRRSVQIINNDQFLKPFGYLDEPLRDAVLYGTGCAGIVDDAPVISPPVDVEEHITPVKGWALDLGTRQDTGRVAYAELLVDGVRWLSTDDCGLVAGRFANCYGLPRFDVARYYPMFPDAPRAGFFFTLDVGTLLNIGVRPGIHNLMVRVGDREQTFTELPNRDGMPVWFQCVDDNFDFIAIGFIDFPTKNDYVSGNVTFRGWAVEDQSNVVTVEIFVDGDFMGLAAYGYPRSDVGDQFPQFPASKFSGWNFTMDSRKLGNSIHRLTVRTKDSQGRTSEIGSTDFYVLNANPQP
jgi:Bacterial Ig domain